MFNVSAGFAPQNAREDAFWLIARVSLLAVLLILLLQAPPRNPIRRLPGLQTRAQKVSTHGRSSTSSDQALRG